MRWQSADTRRRGIMARLLFCSGESLPHPTGFISRPQNAMQIVGFMEDEVQSVLELVAAVLKLGNIEFKPESRCNGADESRVKDKNGTG